MGDTSTGTTAACVCTPGEVDGCDGAAQNKCAADCLGFEPAPCPPAQKCMDGVCMALFCDPGVKVCEGEGGYKQCNGDGSAFDPPVNCQNSESCVAGDCLSLCAQAEAAPSTIGCSFIGIRADNFYDANDSLVVGNTSKNKTASVQLYFVPNGTNVEQAQGAPVMILPGKTYAFPMSNQPIDKASGLRKGGNYRVQSDIPIIAYQHSPITGQATNDASMLLPEHALKQDYVVASYKDGLGSYPSYFDVIAIADGTTVSWTPPQPTLAGTGVAAINAGQTGQMAMNRFVLAAVDPPDMRLGAALGRVRPDVLLTPVVERQHLLLDVIAEGDVVGHVDAVDRAHHPDRLIAGDEGARDVAAVADPHLQRVEAVHQHLAGLAGVDRRHACLLYTSPSPRDRTRSRMPSSA